MWSWVIFHNITPVPSRALRVRRNPQARGKGKSPFPQPLMEPIMTPCTKYLCTKG